MLELHAQEGLNESSITEILTPYSFLEGAVYVSTSNEGAFSSMGANEAFIPYCGEGPSQTAKLAVYKLLAGISGKPMAWGALTGVKPVKKYDMLIRSGFSKEAARNYFARNYLISEPKMSLVEETYQNQLFGLGINEKQVSIYANIPICPSKCTYCSFPSIVTNDRALLEKYLDSLEREIEAVSPLLSGKGMTVVSAYIGGGTPTVLSEKQLGRLMGLISPLLAGGAEVTIEAGRADTSTIEKLAITRHLGANRVCINPQTTTAAALEASNRHIANELFAKAIENCKQLGYSTINCDLLLGLEHESRQSAIKSLRDVMSLSPQSITLHSLAKKRNSELPLDAVTGNQLDVSSLHDEMRAILSTAGFEPYYLYKQKYAASSAENVGYSLKGHESFYNISMMSDRGSIIGVGAGSASKILSHGDPLSHENRHNTKDVVAYIKNPAGTIEAKTRFIEKMLYWA
ncbi:MAG: coproporphyrinogen dehydrogenase HemZ [Eubacteriaceae bacterium]|nr:coproporphyrinogen dehydrogenase HemZ [Eubacteriaceae bacterium]